MTKIAVSILTIQGRLIDIIKKLEQTDADYFHIDIMDGKFVPNRSFTFGEIKKLSKYTTKKLDVHLMVDNPIKYIEDYATLDVEYITIHYEINKDLTSIINKIKDCGIRCGLSIKPKTSIHKIVPYLAKIDLILLMSVNPGRGGQEFLSSTVDRIKALKEIITKHGYNTVIEVDGGINDETAKLCIEAGADILVSGSYVLSDNDYQTKINQLKNN
ncbi:MAG: ribulose-phosphate 3-epimerase [Bacilli bacterium]